MPFTITPVAKSDIDALIRDKYGGDKRADISGDVKRLAAGEPLAYVIGWQPFLGLKIYLENHDRQSNPQPPIRPLIPRPETEWWTEKLITHLQNIAESKPFEEPLRVLDLCAGSGAIGLAILSKIPTALVSFGELIPELATIIQKNTHGNNIDISRTDIRTGNLFEPFANQTFDIIATNPPYIPSNRLLDSSVSTFEPHDALFSGTDGLDLIRQIIAEASKHLNPEGELWMECDTSNIETAAELGRASFAGASVTIQNDLYDRPRLLIISL